ncbi:MAG: O-methyltransferase [Clostridiales bacterium]|nr:O-methyltransferase [Clostridiales bacterium]
MLNEIKRLREEAKTEGNPVLRDESFELLLSTVKEVNPKSILEVGVNVGLSSVAMLCTCPNATLTGIEISEDCYNTANKNFKRFGVENRAKVFLGDASEIIPVLTGKYDFIFLDGPKGHYFEYLENLLSALNKGGVLFADNVLFRGYVLDEVKTPHRHATIKHSLENFLNRITTDKTLKTVLYKTEDGVSITKKL